MSFQAKFTHESILDLSGSLLDSIQFLHKSLRGPTTPSI